MSSKNTAENISPVRRRRFGDRAEGRLLRGVSPMTRVAVFIMGNRIGALNSIRDEVDTAEIDRYVREKKAEGLRNFNFMHVIIAAYVRTVAQMPALNRFIAGHKIFARNNIEIALTIKKEMTLESPDTVIKIEPRADMTPTQIYELLSESIDAYREQPGGSFDKTAKLLSRLPGLLMLIAIKLIRFIDYLGFLPRALTRISPFHASMFITSMGSLGIPPIYHHLYDFGNCPVFIAFGAKERRYELNVDGESERHDYVGFTVVMDERICDGYYYAAALKKIRRYLRSPELLDTPPEHVVEDVD